MSSPSSYCIHNVSLVAFYRNKPPQLTALIDELQIYLERTSILKGKFQSYPLEQIHGTIIGCEGISTKQGIISKWFLENRQELRYIDLDRLSQYFQKSDRFPLILRFGGYNPNLDYKFLSRNHHPFARSFHLQSSTAKTTLAILIGWSFQNGCISFALDHLRRHAQKFNCLHKYHYLPQTIDNDFYLCLGIFKEQLKLEDVLFVQEKIRKKLQAKPPIHIPLNKKDLAFVSYQDPSLPVKTTKIVKLLDLTPAKLERL